jgi:glycosyltransferase involved in cell wall biosynthesis
MAPRACLVVTTTATQRGEVLAAAIHGLQDAGWDARLFCKGDGWERDPALRDPTLERRVEVTSETGGFPLPPALRRRPGELAHYLRAGGETGPFDQRLLELRPDLVHFHSGWSAWRSIRLRGILGCRVVISLRADGQDLEVPDPALLWDADLFVFPDQAALDRAAARGWPCERAEVLPPPVNPPGNGRGAEPGSLRVLSVAPVSWEQGLEHAVHAVRLLADMGVDCEYKIVGDGDHTVAVAFARHQLGLTERVEILPPDGGDGLTEALAAADVLVDPAVTDGAEATSLQMAQTMGIPFVATHRSGLPEDAGIAVPRRDARALADALAALAHDSDLRRRMGDAGRRRMGVYPSVGDHVRRLVELYARLADEPA